VAERDGQGGRVLAAQDVTVGAVDAARLDAHNYLVGAWHRVGDLPHAHLADRLQPGR
jgi:hypothetical protein